MYKVRYEIPTAIKKQYKAKDMKLDFPVTLKCKPVKNEAIRTGSGATRVIREITHVGTKDCDFIIEVR